MTIAELKAFEPKRFQPRPRAAMRRLVKEAQLRDAAFQPTYQQHLQIREDDSIWRIGMGSVRAFHNACRSREHSATRANDFALLSKDKLVRVVLPADPCDALDWCRETHRCSSS